MKKVELTQTERDMIDSLSSALSSANDDAHHANQDRSFGAIASALFATIEHAAALREPSLWWHPVARTQFRAEFFASWYGDRAADLAEDLLNAALFATIEGD